MYYIQRKDNNGLETVDEFETRKEAQDMRYEYTLSDYSARYYISTRACKDWRNDPAVHQSTLIRSADNHNV